MQENEVKRYGPPIAEALVKYRNSAAVHWAYRIADEELLRYVPAYSPGCGVRLRFAEQAADLFAMVRNQGVTAEQAVQRVCTTWAFIESNPDRFPNIASENSALARGFMRLVSPNYARPGAQALRHMGERIRRSLGQFVTTLLKRIEDDAEAHRRAFSAQSFDEVAK